MKDYSEQELAEIGKQIDGMTAICEKGKKEVRGLVEKLVGKPLAGEIRLEGGQLWRSGPSYCDMLIVRDQGRLGVIFFDRSEGVGARSCDWREDTIKIEIKRGKYTLAGRITDIVNQNP